MHFGEREKGAGEPRFNYIWVNAGDINELQTSLPQVADRPVRQVRQATYIYWRCGEHGHTGPDCLHPCPRVLTKEEILGPKAYDKK